MDLNPLVRMLEILWLPIGLTLAVFGVSCCWKRGPRSGREHGPYDDLH